MDSSNLTFDVAVRAGERHNIAPKEHTVAVVFSGPHKPSRPCPVFLPQYGYFLSVFSSPLDFFRSHTPLFQIFPTGTERERILHFDVACENYV